ncbi:sigma-54-dependent Fis family transcriptional regulator [candidate division TA06 bacterium]|uniref:Sigma-54-dependent Fis family transcriptional regulator n=1 Tax=candidate division TA06 bacterium TaxID=2250710 RepID=A0A523USW7_UNCT6|nr:MAG: sigma-54-dependent Fis family transcriptional regulator [candidate division TA06 bacterium]
MPMEKCILAVDDESEVLDLLKSAFHTRDIEVITARDGEDGLNCYLKHRPDIVIADLIMPRMDGAELLESILEYDPSTAVIILTGHGTIDTAVEAMKKGAYYYITKPFDMSEVFLLVDRVMESRKIQEEHVFLQSQMEQLYGVQNIIGDSPPLRDVFEQIRSVSQTDSTVLIAGESGTGKELVATAIHYSSMRRNKPFVKVSCAALPEGIIESELFGHEKGAFTSAYSRRTGRFELANGGTLFLDEIGDLPISTQVKLLRVLESREFERVGGSRTMKVDVRLISASNQDLEVAVKERRFREDLLYRLNVIVIRIPPLRERSEDIRSLARYFLEKYSREMNKPIRRISKKVLNILNSYHWPGNVRELENAIERAVVFCRREVLTDENLSLKLRATASGLPVSLDLPSYSIAGAERILLEKAVRETDWNLKRAAEVLGISRGTLYSKLRKYGMERQTKRIPNRQ